MRKLILLPLSLATLVACSGPADAPTEALRAFFSYPDGSPHPVTAWGEPDLQGKWPIMHLFATRLQRDPKYGERRELNDEEWEAAEKMLERRDAPYETEIKSNKMGMGHWAETTMRSEAARLTSLISYPPDGQMPALTARGEAARPAEFRSDDTSEGLRFDGGLRCVGPLHHARACRRRCCRSTTTTVFEIVSRRVTS